MTDTYHQQAPIEGVPGSGFRRRGGRLRLALQRLLHGVRRPRTGP